MGSYLLVVPSVCPPLAPILGLSRVSHYFSVFSLLVPRSNLSSFATGSSLRAESLLSGFSYILSHGSLLVHFSYCISRLLRFLLPFLGVSVTVCFGGFFLAVSFLILVAGWLSRLRLFVSVPLSEALSLILGFSQLILFPLFFLVISSHPVTVHLSAFNLIDYVFFMLLGRDSGKFSRLPPQVFSFSSSSPPRPLRLASSSIPAGPLCPGDTIACPLPYMLRNEPVVMVWSTHSHIGRCSCGDSWIHRVVSSPLQLGLWV